MNSDALSLIYRYKKSPVIDRIRIGGETITDLIKDEDIEKEDLYRVAGIAEGLGANIEKLDYIFRIQRGHKNFLVYEIDKCCYGYKKPTNDIKQYFLTKSPFLKTLKKSGRFIVADATDIPFDRKCFNFATMFGLLYHLTVKEKKETIKEAFRVLKNGGKVLGSTYSKKGVFDANDMPLPWESICKKLNIIYEKSDGYYNKDGERISGFWPVWSRRYPNFYGDDYTNQRLPLNEKELKYLLRFAGFTHIKITEEYRNHGITSLYYFYAEKL